MRNRIVAILSGLFLTTPLLAAITGTVMTSEGQPIAGAKVTISISETSDARRERLLTRTDRVPIASAQSDAKGTFRFESPKDAVVFLHVEARGYAPTGLRVERDGEISAIPLRKAETKSGTITANGKPVAGAAVLWSGSTDAFATTDAEGHYSVSDPSKWANRLIVVHPDFAVLDERSQMMDDSMKKKLDRSLDPGTKIAGRVVGVDGQTPVAKATIAVDGWPLATSADDGTFTIAHAPKKVETLAARSGNLSATRASSNTAATLRLARSASLTGTLRDAKSRAPIAGALIRVARSMRFESADLGSAITDAKGNYSFLPIAPGSYQLFVSHPSYSFNPVSVSVTAGQDATRTFSAPPLARIVGSVIDDDKRGIAAASIRPGEDPTVRAPMMMTRAAMMEPTYSGPDGRFIFRTADENVDIKARKKGLPEGSSGPIKVAAGERKSGVVITIPRGLEVAGRITDRNEKPLSGVEVTAASSEDGPRGMMFRRMRLAARDSNEEDVVRSASDGTFSIRLKEGTYDLSFARDGFATKRVRGHHVAAGVKPLEVVLDPGVEITGRVMRGGTPVDGVSVMTIGESSANTTTGPDGTFRIGDLTPGSLMVNFMKQDEFIQEIRSLTAPARDVVIDLPRGGRVTGRVFDKGSRQPVTSFQAGVSMSRSTGGMAIMMPPVLRSVTSDDGTFTLENVPSGPLQLVVSAPGYTTARLANLTLEEGKSLEGVEVALESGTRVTGRVTDASGTPIGGASVRLDMFNQRRGGRSLDGGSDATTDDSGEYTLESIEPGEKTLTATHNSYLSAQKTVEIAGKEQRVDFQLSNGLRVTGQVVTEGGVPVGDASVRASSASGGSHESRTDAGGLFSMENLSPGRYSFTASKQGQVSASLDDFDIAGGGAVRLIMKGGGTIYGRVTGLSESDLANATVTARGNEGGSGSAPIDSTGAYRIEGAPTGTVRISAMVQRGLGERRTSATRTLQLDAGSMQEVNLEFPSDTVVRGHVTRNGRPLTNASVSFFPRGGSGQTSASAPTDDKGEYTINGLSDGKYNVSVMDMQRMSPYSTSYEVSGSGTFDIDMRVSSIRGRVIDAESGEAIANARVQLRAAAGTEGMFGSRTTNSDTNGVFLLDSVGPGHYSVLADMRGYGNVLHEIDVTESAPDDVELKLTRNPGVTLSVIDARDGNLLNAYVNVRDLQGRVIDDTGYSFFGGGTPEPVRLSLAPGQYRATITAMGYAGRTVTLTSPGDLTVGLTPGGKLVIRSSRAKLHYGRLIDDRGAPYSLTGSRFPEFRIEASPAPTKLDEIVAGTYTLQLLGDDNRTVIDTRQVTVVDGATVVVDL